MAIFSGTRYPVIVATFVVVIIVSVMTGSNATDNLEDGTLSVEQNAVGTVESQINSNGTNTVSKSSNRSKSRTSSKARQEDTVPGTLPANAQSIHPTSLLWKIKIRASKNYLTYTECFDSTGGKCRRIGYKAMLTLNATVAGIPPSSNPFIGYGKSKISARRIAAENALMAAYPGKLTYPIVDTSLIEPYCDDE